MVTKKKGAERTHDPDKFKVGDRVRIVRGIKSREGGWDNSWESEMDEHVNDGVTYVVDRTAGTAGVKLAQEDGSPAAGGWTYPTSALELATEASATAPATTKTDAQGETVAKEAEKVVVGEVVRLGTQFVIPEGITLRQAIELLERKIREEEEVVSLSETVDAFLWDGALALAKAMERKFGYAMQEARPGWFGPTPPKMVAVECGVDQTIQVPWGDFSLPGIDGKISTGYTEKKGIIVLAVNATIKRKHRELIHELVAEAKRIVKEESLYRGKAVQIRWKDDEGKRNLMPQPTFLDLAKVRVEDVVFSKEVESAITTSVFTPIEHAEECRKLKIPLKRGVLFSGRYGTGKTLVSNVTAVKCVESGWTFLHCPRADELEDMVRFAHRYQPAVIFCEDIDRTMHGERTVEIDDVLNIIDGIESKGAEIMVVLTTNHLENINPAMLRPGRLDAIINVLPPDAEAVERLVRLYGGKLVPENADLAAVGEKLAGQIPAVIRECVERSKLAAIKLADGGPLVLTQEALLDAAVGMKNQIDLLAQAAEPVTAHEKMVKVLGDKVLQGLDVAFPNGNGNGHKE